MIKDKKVRKTIVLPESIEKELKEMAKYYNKPQSTIIEELLKEKLQEYKMKKRLEAFERITKRAEFFAGVTENKTFQELKEEMGSEY
ncbi:hypothetical protein SAMN06265182_0857 [Persephonella hydrogeniphila]|uniref:Uncharacterized protein n=1 Tax=Persephonella hydrogeniphila TaxID=198703 RepID=A0A285NDC4_9AQUI|nr:hypothetical protein [Persephonella hydrogeniphila]SNZ06957.1 hypothetical protein SAMN06265182_0857 [Persephonella hydrogeniphila]